MADSDHMVQDAAGEMQDLGCSRRLCDLEQPQGCFWLGQLQLSPGISAAGLQQSHVLFPFPFLLASGISNLKLIIELASLAICHPGISLYGSNHSLLAGTSHSLCSRTFAFTFFMNRHQQHLLQSGKSGSSWEVADFVILT